MTLNIESGLIWKTPWPDEKELFLKFAKIRNSRNSQNSVLKPNFFPRQAIPYTNKFFALHCHYTGDTQYRVWFDLNNSLTRWKRPIFKIPCSRNSKVPCEILTFFLGRLHQKFFLFYPLITLVIFHAKFGLIWTTPSPDEKEIFLSFAKKICNTPNFFARKTIPKILFTLHFHYTGDIPYQVWFDLDNSRWKRNFFKICKNSQFAKLAKFSMKTQFFP